MTMLMFLEATQTLAPSSPALPTGVGVAIVFGYLLDVAKRLKQVPKINYYTQRLNFAIRVIMSGIGTLGVSWVWSSTTTGGHQFILNLPAWSIITTGIWHWVIQYGVQHGFEIQLYQRETAKRLETLLLQMQQKP